MKECLLQRLPILLTALLISFIFVGCSFWSKRPAPEAERAENQATITGSVTYRERMALRPGSVVRVTLEDISLADAPAKILAEQILHPQNQVPIPFSLSYDRAQIQPRHRYALRAQIRTDAGQLLWTTDTVHPVLTQGAPTDTVEIALVRVGKDQPDHSGMMPQEAGRTYVYECAANAKDDFRFTVRTGPGELALWLPARFNRPYLVLSQVRAASGAKYQEGDVVVWTKGGEALLEIAGQTYEGCTENRRRSIWEHAKLSGVDFRATGNEPGWHVEITEGRRIQFTYDYGQRQVVAPTPQPDVDAENGRTVYHAQTEAHNLKAIIESTPCTDTMSGEIYSVTTTVVLDGKTYRGCGRSLH